MLGAWVTLLTALILVVPGAVVARRAGLPWPVAVAAGPPVTFTIVSLATVLYGVIGFEWNLVTAALALIAALVLAWGHDRLFRTRPGRRLTAMVGAPDIDGDAGAADGAADPRIGRRGVLALVAGVAIGAVIIAITCIRPLVKTAPGGLENISQVWDSLWHASSLRFIHESGVGSALRMGELMNYDTHGFNYYPNTWHAVGALLFPITDADPVELYNTYSPAVLAITIPFGVAALAYWLARHRFSADRSAFLAGVAAAMSALFSSLPYVEIQLTSVPNAVGVSLAPIAAVLTIGAVRDARRIVPAAVALAGVTATHPSGLVFAAVLVGLWWLFEALWRPARTRLVDFASLVTIGVGALVLSLPVILGTIRIADNNELAGFDFRDESAGMVDALAQGAFNGTIPLERTYPIWELVLAAAIGFVVLIWARCWAGLAAWLVFVLVTANSVVALGPLSYPLGTVGGYFYNSGHRLTFVTAIFSAAAAGVGIGALVLAAAAGVSRLIRTRRDASTWVTPVAAVLLFALIAVGGVLRYPDNAIIASKERDGRFVGADDIAAYEWLAAQPDIRGTVVLNNLDQGTGWLYPVTGLTPLFPFYRANSFSQRQRDLFWGVAQIGADPEIDRIARDLNVHYVIDSPPSYWEFQRGVPDPENGHQGDPFLELRQKGAPGLTPVFTRGEATVYRVDDSVFATG
ncbi:DUF6541 family protein [Gordonia soli]|uniref:Glycosyltransferase RgtA/B/C/D-like domain-containing protein n=1 Tax=Gordonia soli NBRC 108243 TaxID=1223545 RepID=M0QGZ1_9ACTN|nr:hypothetical protein GS4_08_01660 [Gordonia soli NBRC 108243]